MGLLEKAFMIRLGAAGRAGYVAGRALRNMGISAIEFSNNVKKVSAVLAKARHTPRDLPFENELGTVKAVEKQIADAFQGRV